MIEAEITNLSEGCDENFCCVTVKVVTPDQPKRELVMSPPDFSAISTKMLTKIGASLVVLLALALPALAQDVLLDRVVKLEAKMDLILAKIDKMAATPIKASASQDVCYNLGGCKCGCIVTGQCVCKDCNHPQLTDSPKAASWPLLPPTYGQPGVSYQSFDAGYGASSGGCANGSCSTGQGLIGRIFRRR